MERIHKCITDYIGVFALHTPGYNNQTDVAGHGFLEIYLNRHLTTYTHFIKNVKSIFDKFAKSDCAKKPVKAIKPKPIVVKSTSKLTKNTVTASETCNRSYGCSKTPQKLIDYFAAFNVAAKDVTSPINEVFALSDGQYEFYIMQAEYNPSKANLNVMCSTLGNKSQTKDFPLIQFQP